MSNGRVIEIGAAELKAMMDAGEAHVFDVRESSEHARARIPDTTLAPLSTLRPDQIKAAQGKRAVLYCASGNRTRHAAKMLLEAGHAEAIHLKGGIAAWKQAGFPLAADPKAPSSIRRRVQLIAGLFAGLTGRCGLAGCRAKPPHGKV